MFGYYYNEVVYYYSETNQYLINNALLNNWKNIVIIINIINTKYITHTINFNTGIILINNGNKQCKIIKNNQFYIKPSFQEDIKLINEDSYYKKKVECPICMENEKIMGLACGHSLCYGCTINPKTNNCPICRKLITYADIRRTY